MQVSPNSVLLYMSYFYDNDLKLSGSPWQPWRTTAMKLPYVLSRRVGQEFVAQIGCENG